MKAFDESYQLDGNPNHKLSTFDKKEENNSAIKCNGTARDIKLNDVHQQIHGSNKIGTLLKTNVDKNDTPAFYPSSNFNYQTDVILPGDFKSECDLLREFSRNDFSIILHVDAGELISLRMGLHLQEISGPATIRLFSINGPLRPIPMHVPAGHLVQQFVDEEGILTHIVLSPLPGPPSPYLHDGAPLNYDNNLAFCFKDPTVSQKGPFLTEECQVFQNIPLSCSLVQLPQPYCCYSLGHPTLPVVSAGIDISFPPTYTSSDLETGIGSGFNVIISPKTSPGLAVEGPTADLSSSWLSQATNSPTCRPSEIIPDADKKGNNNISGVLKVENLSKQINAPAICCKPCHNNEGSVSSSKFVGSKMKSPNEVEKSLNGKVDSLHKLEVCNLPRTREAKSENRSSKLARQTKTSNGSTDSKADYNSKAEISTAIPSAFSNLESSEVAQECERDNQFDLKSKQSG